MDIIKDVIPLPPFTLLQNIIFLCLLNFPHVNGFLMCSMIPKEFDSGFGCTVTEPQCPNENVTFWLYTRDTQETPHQLDMARADETIRPEFFHQDVPLVVLIHGYTGHRDFSPNKEIRPAYFSRGDYNIISVDYGPLAQKPCYFSAVRNLPTVANCTARLLDYMEQNQVMDMQKYQIIGFSLGGQTSGMVSTFKESRIPRITALDPAKPCFVDVPLEYKLDEGDADFVSVLHTDALARGVLSRAGHVDFYVNGGLSQPGCVDRDGELGSCNHDRAPIYYAESINTEKGFYGYQCRSWFEFMAGTCHEREDSYLRMGDDTPETARGSYFVTTNKIKPFAKGRLADNRDVLTQFWSFIFPTEEEQQSV